MNLLVMQTLNLQESAFFIIFAPYYKIKNEFEI